MKTIFTFKNRLHLATGLALVFLAFGLKTHATIHQVNVVNYKFEPKEITITEGDTVIWTNTNGNHNVNGQKSVYPSNPESFGNSLGSNWSYQYIFNTAGTYDYQCDPHIGMGMVGKVTVNEKQTNNSLVLTVNFNGMNPHVGQTLWLAVTDKATGIEIGRKSVTVSQSFSVDMPGIEAGKSYNVDFFADHNGNGIYDAPPTDHAWRMDLNDVAGNAVLEFTHNTTFTDIVWKYKLTVHFTGMTPHLGQKVTLFLIWADTGFYQDTLVVPSVPAADFDINSYEIKPGFNYSINFYADHNNNGIYDSPPTDHAWHLFVEAVKGDTIVNFAHNTNFTDILPTTGTKITDAQKIRLYPNPASQYIELSLPQNYAPVRSVKVYSITGSVIEAKTFSETTGQIRYNLSRFKSGVYFMEINTANRKDVLKFIKQ